MVKKLTLSLLLVTTLFACLTAQSQDLSDEDSSSGKIKLNLGADIMSSYVWRGTDFGASPCIQPTLSVSAGNLEVGTWGSVATNSFYKEVDLYAKYTVKRFSLILTDYYVPSLDGTPASPDTRYFSYDNEETAHSLEASVLYKGGEKLPLWLLGGVFFYGNDKRWGYDAEKDSTNETYYSTYLEAGYSLTIKDNSADIFLGFTPFAGAYGNTMGVVNMGVTGYRKIKITEDFELPVKASLIFNPMASNVFLTFGITL